MDAVGIDKVLIGEAHGFSAKMLPLGEELPNGAVRVSYPFSERAVELYPDRFVYHVQVDYRDPDLARLMQEVRTRPGAVCIRIVPIPTNGELDAFAFELLTFLSMGRSLQASQGRNLRSGGAASLSAVR